MMVKRSLQILIALLCSGFVSSAGNLQAFFSYASFYSPEKGPYIETYITVIGSSVEFGQNQAGDLQAAVEVTMAITQGEKDIYFDKYILLSPSIRSEKDERPNFLDQQRIPLANGNYEVSVSIRDTSSSAAAEENHFSMELNFPGNRAFISDIELVDSYTTAIGTPSSFTKSGLDIIPYAMDYYPEDMDKITFYAEVYHTDRSLGDHGRYLVRYFIESYEREVPVARFSAFKKQEAAPVNVIFGEFPLQKLHSGTFNLVVEVRDSANNLLAASKRFFQRSNPNAVDGMADLRALDITQSFAFAMNDKDSLAEHIRCLRPISSEREVTFAENAVKSDDLQLMQQYFYSFWLSRNELEPEKAWKAYEKEVQEVEKMFGTRLNRGYGTDRGRVYLQYGAPNSVAQSYNEPNAYPYEIWHYYKLKSQSNRRFVFYNPDLVTNDFTLLHSDARGEVYNSQWDLEIHQRTNPVGNIDENDGNKHIGGRAKDLYRTPR